MMMIQLDGMEICGSFTPSREGRTWALPEDCYESEDAEFSIESAEIVDMDEFLDSGHSECADPMNVAESLIERIIEMAESD